MAYSYKGGISFGMVYIPIVLSVVVKNNDISFNMLDKKTKSRVQYKKTCVDCQNREVKNEDIVKGYQYEEDKYVIFEKEDFEKIKTKKDKTITIMQFVDLKEIDPIYYEKSYYVVPQGAEKAYKLLLTAMQEMGKVAIAKAVLGSKQSLILVRAVDDKMLLSTLYFEEEVQVSPIKESGERVDEKELDLAKTLIENMTDKFDIKEYKDEYRLKVIQAIEQKIAGKEVVIPKEEKENSVLNLMEALQASLKTTKVVKKKPTAKIRTKKRA